MQWVILQVRKEETKGRVKMLKRLLAIGAAASIATSPSIAAGLEASYGERRSSAAAGLYFSVPFGGAWSGTPQAGLRLQMSHDYRNAVAQTAPVVQANAFDLRLVGDRETTFYVAGVPVNGEEARKRNLTGVNTLTSVAILAAAVVGAVVIINAIDDDDDEEKQCLLPEGCP